MRILGIDPGTGRTGYGVIDLQPTKDLRILAEKKPISDNISLPQLNVTGAVTLLTFGCIETPKEDEMPMRLVAIRQAIKALLAEFKPHAVPIELLFHGPNAKTVMAVGQARGVVIEAVAEEKIPIFDYQGLAIKKVISGSGKADKKQMQEIMRQFFSLESVPKPDDAADGLAIALCHALNFIEQI